MAKLLDPEVDAQCLNDTLESLEGEIEDKAENIAKLIRQTDLEIEIIKKEIERLSNKRQLLESGKERLKAYLKNEMELLNTNKISTPLFRISIQNNPPAVEVLDIKKIPENYFKMQDPVLDKKILLQDLKEGLPISGAKIKHSQSLRVR